MSSTVLYVVFTKFYQMGLQFQGTQSPKSQKAERICMKLGHKICPICTESTNTDFRGENHELCCIREAPGSFLEGR